MYARTHSCTLRSRGTTHTRYAQQLPVSTRSPGPPHVATHLDESQTHCPFTHTDMCMDLCGTNSIGSAHMHAYTASWLYRFLPAAASMLPCQAHKLFPAAATPNCTCYGGGLSCYADTARQRGWHRNGRQRTWPAAARGTASPHGALVRSHPRPHPAAAGATSLPKCKH